MYQEMALSCGKRLYIEWSSRKEKSRIACLLAGVWQLKGMGRNMDKRRRMSNTH
jgi:hypothetical protein